MIAHPSGQIWPRFFRTCRGEGRRAFVCCQCCQFCRRPPAGRADPWLWVAFCAGTAALLLLDMFVFHRACPRADAPRVGAVDRVLVHAGAGVQRPGLVARRLAARRAVSHRLPDRMVVVDGQRVRVRGDLCVLRRAAEVSVSRAVLGHPRRDLDAADVHPGGRQAARAVRMGAVHLRRVPGLHGLQAGPLARRRDASGSEHLLLRFARKYLPRGPRLARRQVLRPAGRQAVRHVAVPGAAGDREHRRGVRHRQRAGDLRHHATTRSSCSRRTCLRSWACGRCTSCWPA